MAEGQPLGVGPGEHARRVATLQVLLVDVTFVQPSEWATNGALVRGTNQSCEVQIRLAGPNPSKRFDQTTSHYHLHTTQMQPK